MNAKAYDFPGYVVGYSLEKAQLRVYTLALLACGFTAAWAIWGNSILFIVGAALACGAYYFYPMSETNTPRIGATQYGVFIDGFGLIAWHAVADIKLIPIAMRSILNYELQIKLSKPLDKALVADWRQLPWYRLLMYLPWRMSHDNVVRVDLEPLDEKPDVIHHGIMRVRKFHSHKSVSI